MFFLLQNIFITFSRHNYGKTEWDVALTWKEKSAKYFSKNMLLTKGTFKCNASISQFQQCPSPQDNSGHLQDFYALEWTICTFHINPGRNLYFPYYPILRPCVGHGMATLRPCLLAWIWLVISYTSIYQKCLKKNILLVFISLYVCI